MLNIRAGFVGFGEVNTPHEWIATRCAAAAAELEKRGVTLVCTAPVCDDPAGRESERAIRELKQGEFDALVVCVAGWIPSWAVVKTIEPFRHLPILLWGLSGRREGADRHFVTTADQAGTTALRAPLAAMGYNFKYLVNFQDAPPRCDEAATYLTAASAAAALRGAVIGMSGYRDMRLYGTLYHGTLLKKITGVEIEHFDLLELCGLMEQISPAAVAAAAARIHAEWDFVKAPQSTTVTVSARLALALREKITDRHYAAFSFCDVDGIKKLLHFAPAGALTLLHELIELPTVPENDAYGTVTALLLQRLTGVLPGYLEFYEFTANSALMGVPDYVPGTLVDGKITVMPNAFGGFGEGLLNVSKLKTGTVTLARLSEVDGKLVLHMALAEARTPGKWEEAGWTPPAPQLPSLEMRFDFPSDSFLRDVAGQHYIVSFGDRRMLLRDYCAVTGITCLETRN